ncbi:M [plateatu pika coronavirus P83]|nr:M [plateatu pika coronavirus P83] [plateatu pika coronavirus P83]
MVLFCEFNTSYADNCTACETQGCTGTGVTSASVTWHLLNWNFSWSVILTAFVAVLQYGNLKYSMILYILKMIIMWLLWPVVIALTIFDAVETFRNERYVMFGFSIALGVITLILWVMYFFNSFRLYRRTSSWWSFNPETNAIICLSVMGRNLTLPTPVCPTGITLTLLSGVLFVEGQRAASGVNIDNLPTYVTVAKPSVTIVYHRVGKSIRLSTATGWVYYVKSKAGDYSAYTAGGSLTDQEQLLHMT